MSNLTARLRWRCRRGMRELDQLLSGYLERRYPQAPAAEKAAFAALLELPDPQLAGYFLGRVAPEEPAVVAVVKRILESR